VKERWGEGVGVAIVQLIKGVPPRGGGKKGAEDSCFGGLHVAP
jgi:hypothetical protein